MNNESVPNSAVLDCQRTHRSVRKYTGEPIDDALLTTLIQAAQCAASSSFIQAYSLVRVNRPEARSRIAKAAGGQRWIEQAAVFFVCCADLRRIDHACQDQGRGELEGWSEHSLAAVVDCALFGQNLLLAAESVGLGGLFIGGIRNDPQQIVVELALPSLVLPVFGLCLGWPSEQALQQAVKPRMPAELILHQDRYRDVDPAEIGAYDATMASYYRERGTNARMDDWSAATANAIQGKKRKHMLDFMRGRGFFKR
ncbi:MAG: oxygen-insensitive NADPH nitroreductase [Thiohalocapsa sp.]